MQTVHDCLCKKWSVGLPLVDRKNHTVQRTERNWDKDGLGNWTNNDAINQATERIDKWSWDVRIYSSRLGIEFFSDGFWMVSQQIKVSNIKRSASQERITLLVILNTINKCCFLTPNDNEEPMCMCTCREDTGYDFVVNAGELNIKVNH